jgi:hypothetical protein
VRSIFTAWEQGDFSSAEWADPEIEYISADGPDPFSVTGVSAMAAAWRSVLGTWEEIRTEVEECRELDDGRVLALLSWSGRGRRSGFDLADVPWKGASLFQVRNGRVARLVLYFDRERALADLGLKG